MSIEFLLVLAILCLIAVPVALLILFVRTASIRRELDTVRQQLLNVPAGDRREAATKTPVQTVSEPAQTAPIQPPAAGPERRDQTVPVIPKPAERGEPSRPTPSYQPSNDPVTRFIDNSVGLIKRYFTEGNLIVRVGVIVLFVGITFLLNYARQRYTVPVEYSLIGAGLLGVGLLVLGWRLRIKRLGYALILQGGGIGVLYLTLFAAFRIFQLLPAGWVFACLLVMVVLSAILSVLQDARSLAVLAISGGFLAPVLTSTGGGSHIALFSYYTMLNIGILSIAWFKSWRLLNLIGFTFTFVIGTAWGVTKYSSDQFASTETFLVIFFLFYVGIALLFARRQPPHLKGYVDGTMVFGVPIVAFSLQAGLVHDYKYGLAWSSFVLGAFYIVLAWIHWIRGGNKLRLLSEAFLALGVVFATLTIPFALDGEWIATAWALEGAAIVWVSIRQQKRLGVAFALSLQLFAGLGFLMESPGRYADWPVLNSVFMGAVFVALAGILSSYFLYRYYSGEKRWEIRLSVPFLIWGLCWWFGNGLAEINEYVSNHYILSVTVAFFAGSSAVLGLVERQLKWPVLKHNITGLTAVLVLLLLIVVVEHDHPFVYGGYLSWLLMFVVFYGLLKQRDVIKVGAIKTLGGAHAIGLWALTVLLAVELHWQIRNYFVLSGSWQIVSAALVSLLMIMTVLHLKRWPVSTHYKTYLSWGLGPITGYLLLWSVFANVACDGDMAPLPYLPLINPLDIVQAVVLISLYNWWREYLKLTETGINFKQITAVLSGVIFIWLNAVLLRSLHHGFGVAYDADAMWNSLFVQACVSVFWTLLGLAVMIFASRKNWRSVWIAAAGLLGAVVAKLFFVDLAGRETLETIFSFILVGILLLVVGYFSPLPPKRKSLEGA